MNKTVAILPNVYMAKLGQTYESDMCVAPLDLSSSSSDYGVSIQTNDIYA